MSIRVGPRAVADVWNEEDAKSVSDTIVAFKRAGRLFSVGLSSTTSPRTRTGQEVSHGVSIDLSSVHEVAQIDVATWSTVSPIKKHRAGGGATTTAVLAAATLSLGTRTWGRPTSSPAPPAPR